MYPPSEDSYLFAEFLIKELKKFSKEKRKKLKFLDMGTGSGILSDIAKKEGIKDILAVDIDEESLKYVKKNVKVKTIKSNLFSKINKKEKFDIITFNAPYLPEENIGYDNKKDTTGGKEGDEVSLKFLKQAKKHLNKNGRIFLLVSSFTPMKKIKKFNPKEVGKKRIFFEDLIIFEIR